MTGIKKRSSQLMIISNINTLLVTCVTEIEKQQAKIEPYSRENNVEVSSISKKMSDENLEGKVIAICKEAGIDLKPFDTEGCHRCHTLQYLSTGLIHHKQNKT